MNRNKSEQTPREAHKEQIIFDLVEKYIQEKGGEMNSSAELSTHAVDQGLSREAGRRNAIRAKLEKHYADFLENNGGIPPTKEEFENYVESKHG